MLSCVRVLQHKTGSGQQIPSCANRQELAILLLCNIIPFVLFIELPIFTKQIVELVDDERFRNFQKDLLRQPDLGSVIPHSGGLRKARMSLPGRGKSGGARVIYLHLPLHDAIILFYLYTKAHSENLSADQLRRLRSSVAIIKNEFHHQT